MAFLEVRFPDAVAYGFVGGSTYRTSIAAAGSGLEKRNQQWSQSIGRWTATHHGKSQTLTDELIAFFHAVGGRADGFRFKDFTDYTVSAARGTVVSLGNSTWQMYKKYTINSTNRYRKIQKPTSQCSITGGGVYTYVTSTGIITKTSGSDPTGWSGEFDVPCRFDSDEIQIEVIAGPTTNDRGIYQWGNIAVVEIRV